MDQGFVANVEPTRSKEAVWGGFIRLFKMSTYPYYDVLSSNLAILVKTLLEWIRDFLIYFLSLYKSLIIF